MRGQLALLVSRTSPGFRTVCAVIATALACACVYARTRPHVPDTTPIRIASPQEFAHASDDLQRDLADLRGENGRLKRIAARWKGLAEASPDTIIRYDTLIARPDTVMLPSPVDKNGFLDLNRGIAADSGMLKPETAKRINVGNCDNGMVLGGTGIVCNRAMLGHLSIIARGGVSRDALGRLEYPAAAGLRWDHTFRSTSSVEMMIDARARLSAQATVGVRIF